MFSFEFLYLIAKDLLNGQSNQLSTELGKRGVKLITESTRSYKIKPKTLYFDKKFKYGIKVQKQQCNSSFVLCGGS